MGDIPVTPLDFLIIVATICLIILITVLVPILLQIKRTALKIETLIDSVNQEIPPLLQSLNNTSREIQTLMETIKNKVDKTDRVIDTVKAAADTVFVTTSIMKNSVAPLIIQIGAISAGIHTFFRYLTKSH